MGLVWLFILSIALSFQAAAQCCSAGNPLAGTGFESETSKNQWQVSTAFKYSFSDQFYHYDSKVDNPYIENSSFSYENLYLSYGIGNKLNISAEAGYFFDKSQNINFPDGSYSLATGGFGDVSMNIKYTVLKKMKPATQLAVAVGTKIPVGAFEQSINGVTVPVSLQPSSGAFKYTTSIFFQRFTANKKWGLASQAILEMSSEINKNYLIYRYGPYLRFNTGVLHQVSSNLSVSLFGVFDYRGKDTREFDQIVSGSGSIAVYVQPWIQYAIRPNRVVFANIEKPIYRYFFGEQMGNKISAQIGLRFIINKACEN